MSGPIVRTGTTPEFWKNWDRAFGDKKKATDEKKVAEGSKKTKNFVAAKKVVKKAAKKAAKKTK
ncbi:MAG: RNA polymerase subunit sigma [Planctomycetaceae bacterium]